MQSVPITTYICCEFESRSGRGVRHYVIKFINDINNICGKANRILGFLHRNLNIGSTSTKEHAYKLLIEYACSVWDPHLKSDINKIEMV